MDLSRFDFIHAERGIIIQSCSENDYDPRYTKFDVSMTETEIQEKSGVSEIIEDLPMYDELFDPSYRDRKLLSLWTRNTIPWKLECESREFTREEALAKVQSLESASINSGIGSDYRGVTNFGSEVSNRKNIVI